MRLIGLMSGTSVDGIDAALVEIEEIDEIEEAEGRPICRLIAFQCVPWPSDLRTAILNACRHDAPLQQITALNFLLGEAFAEAASVVAAEAQISLQQVDAIASHGQTIWHQPTPIKVGDSLATGTLQIAEPAVIAARTHCVVVADFRCADMALGGQGAPLVPYADLILFADPVETRAIQNLGGIANVTLLPAGRAAESVIAFDTGPGNLLLDTLVRRLTDGNRDRDTDGELAANGRVQQELLDECLTHPFFSLPPPKTTGREMFGEPYAVQFLKRAEAMGSTREDTLATATALTAVSISRAYQDYLLPHGSIQTVILGGGGVHNRTLVAMLAAELAPARLTTHAEFGIPDDAKEAVAFALLGYATLHGMPSNIPSATGATGPAILGKIVLPPNNSRYQIQFQEAYQR